MGIIIFILFAIGAVMAFEGIQFLIYGGFLYSLFYLAIGGGFIYAGISLLEKKQTKKSGGSISPSMMSYYWDLEREIFKQCFNNDTNIFNWDVWFDRRDEIIHTAPENVLLDIDSEFRHCGTLQIYYINAIINTWILSKTPFDPTAGIQKLRREILDTEILTNLPAMFSFKRAVSDRKNCPENIAKYCSLLNDVLYGRTPASRETFEKIVQLGMNIV